MVDWYSYMNVRLAEMRQAALTEAILRLSLQSQEVKRSLLQRILLAMANQTIVWGISLRSRLLSSMDTIPQYSIPLSQNKELL